MEKRSKSKIKRDKPCIVCDLIFSTEKGGKRAERSRVAMSLDETGDHWRVQELVKGRWRDGVARWMKTPQGISMILGRVYEIGFMSGDDGRLRRRN